jgi:hypothetical protein
MKALLTLILGVLVTSSLNAQTNDQKKNLNDRLEAAWKAKSPEAFEALYCKSDADQYLVDVRVSWWTHNWSVGPEPEMKIVRFVSMAELEKLADPKNSDPNQTLYQEALEDITKPQIMNRNSYVHNLPVAGILEVDIIMGRLIRHDRVVVGISPDANLLFTLLKRSEPASGVNGGQRR